MKIVTELALLFSLCLISAGITHLLPVAMPASVVSLLLETLKAYLLPFAVVTLVTTPLVYFVTAWTIQLVLKFRDRQEVPHA